MGAGEDIGNLLLKIGSPILQFGMGAWVVLAIVVMFVIFAVIYFVK